MHVFCFFLSSYGDYEKQKYWQRSRYDETCQSLIALV